ncbi:hypothetical protein [Candidatus Accumulibacter vicinus]|uniref:Uncharacterized protein n=1 Tax=Candidatus Accumulibacter vicinus TaxID=2954382 RepID=A0A084XW31_9PROT|nr:hypothetical protein [Candidatus Accumulibacter vicinus]KFB66675.1 MAG: hypothetical protein CAPSK01_004040 [Candidatus Accumulibacter vicinus]
MAITLNGLALPSGLRWSDEFAWSPLQTVRDYSLTGALILQTAERQAGRPITLLGGERWAWMIRSQLLILQSFLNAYAPSRPLILHDARNFAVAPVYEGDGPLYATPKTRVLDSGLANPGPDEWYVIHHLKLITV